MNSTLQCLSNTPGLTDYFMDDRFLRHINRENPLGWGGRIADEYALLAKSMWSGEFSVLSPHALKHVVGQFQPRFAGYAQQDSSELLSFLLDGLHEDLNSVRKKPPTTTVEGEGRPDKVVAAEAWERHLLRNRSLIVDLFQFQLKSRLVCPECGRESITFDPFMYLSVPLPHMQQRTQEITLIPSAETARAMAGEDGAVAVGSNHHAWRSYTFQLRVPKTGLCSDLKSALIKLVPSLNPKTLLVTEVWNNRIHRVYPDDVSLERIQPKDSIIIYDIPELKANEEQKQEVFTTLAIYHVVLDRRTKRPQRSVGLPAVVSVDSQHLRSLQATKLRALIQNTLSPFIKHGWQADEEPARLYSLQMWDRAGKQPISEVPLKDDALVDIVSEARGVGMSFVVAWDEDSVRRLDTEIPPEHPLSVRARQRNKQKEGIDLYDCIEALTQEEILSRSEAWYCSKCKRHQCATKKFDLWRLPDILIVQLKRFIYTSVYRDKLDAFVDFPIQGLDLGKFVVNEDEKPYSTYDLYAVSNHFGGLGGGKPHTIHNTDHTTQCNTTPTQTHTHKEREIERLAHQSAQREKTSCKVNLLLCSVYVFPRFRRPTIPLAEGGPLPSTRCCLF